MHTLTLQAAYDGTDSPPSAPIPLRAGPLTLVYDGGDLRYIRLGRHEIIRRLYVAVRDHNWGTVPATLSQLEIHATDTSFSITYHAEHRQGAIHFGWHAAISGTADGMIEYRMEGMAQSSFRRNRIGICILHPIHECSGMPCTIEHADGTIDHAHFPAAISPHQPFFAMRAIRHTVIPGVTAEVRFAGDLFEMEDQRNWTDASFKTYSTPLALPYPVEIGAGTSISQSVTLRLEGTPPPAEPDDPALSFGPEPAVAALPIPRIGLGSASHGMPLSLGEIARLRILHPAHLRLDLDLSADFSARLEQAVAEAQALDTRLEVALFCSTAAHAELAALAALLPTLRPPLAGWLIFAHGHKTTPPELLDAARQVLAGYDSQALIAGGTNAYFTELNRGRPELDATSAVCYSLNPQVHAFDNASLVETLEAQGITVQSARRLYGSRPILVSPITLRPRFNPNATGPATDLPGELPATVDRRQMSLFGAGWTLGSLKYLAEAGAARMTYYETTGWRGVMEHADGSTLPEQFRSIAGGVFPLYHVLADIGEYAGGVILPSRSSQPLALDGIVLEQAGRRSTIVANLGQETRHVRIAATAPRVHVRILDETTIHEAITNPESFRMQAGAAYAPAGGLLELQLRPYAVVRIDEEHQEPAAAQEDREA